MVVVGITSRRRVRRERALLVLGKGSIIKVRQRNRRLLINWRNLSCLQELAEIQLRALAQLWILLCILSKSHLVIHDSLVISDSLKIDHLK